MNGEMLFYIICAAVVIAVLVYYAGRRRRLLSVFFGAFSGLAALMLLNMFGEKIGVQLSLNLFNVCGSAVLGVPFVAAAVIINYFL